MGIRRVGIRRVQQRMIHRSGGGREHVWVKMSRRHRHLSFEVFSAPAPFPSSPHPQLPSSHMTIVDHILRGKGRRHKVRGRELPPTCFQIFKEPRRWRRRR